MPNNRHCRILVLVPTFNDSHELERITREIQSLDGSYTPLVVDDGSLLPIDRGCLPKGTLLVRFPTNFGLGVATHVAFDHALGNHYDIVARIDSDGQHPISILPDLVKPIRLDGEDLVVGHRTNRHEGGGGIRTLLAAAVRNYLSFVSRLMTGGKAPWDVNSGLFAVSATAIRKLNMTQLERFPEPQMYVLCGRMGIKAHEIPVAQDQRRHGRSTVTIARALALFYRFNMFVLAELLQNPRQK